MSNYWTTQQSLENTAIQRYISSYRGFTKICNNFWLRLKNDMKNKNKWIMSFRNNIEKDDETMSLKFLSNFFLQFTLTILTIRQSLQWKIFYKKKSK